VMTVLAAIGAAAIGWWALRDMPLAEIAAGDRATVVALETASGDPLIQRGTYQAAYAELDRFPDHLIDAVLAIEDRRFFEHAGLDLRGIGRAALRNLRAGVVVEGGSTITQQLVKIRYLDRQRTFRRKLQEAALSVWLDIRLGKREVLTRYLNGVYLGAGTTGFPAAARIYFGKEVEELDLAESAVLAGLIRSPSQLNPLRNPDGARQRANVVLHAMSVSGRLDGSAVEEAREAVAATDFRDGGEPATGSWYADWAMAQAREIAGSFAGTVRVRTTVDPRLQAQAEQILSTLRERAGEGGPSQGAMVVLRPDGAVLAMVGGVDYEENSFNRAARAMRQPGSAFKLFVYYAALKAGATPRHQVDDAPMEIDGWSPENYGRSYAGRVTLAEAFARSYNAAAVRVADIVGIEEVAAAARELGIDAPLTTTPSLALGTSGVSLLDLTGAFASVRAGVAPIEPWGIEEFSAGESGRAFRVGPSRQPQHDISAYQPDLVEMLRLVVERGTGRAAAHGAFAAGKTGTSQGHRDAWFVGFTEGLVVGVWVGNDDDSPMDQVTGGRLPAEIWREFVVAAAGEGIAEEEFRAPGLMVDAQVDEDLTTGGLGDEGTARIVVHDGAQAARMCNVEACSRRYRSFRPSDCTYQPYHGARRICDIGMESGASRTVEVPRESFGRSGAQERSVIVGQARQRSCNVQACARAYRSFRVEDCTYQPYQGPRRYCTR
jgi:penicillin-binding protein 1A